MEAGGQIPPGSVPGVKARWGDMFAVGAVFKPGHAVVTPGPGKINAPGRYTALAGEVTPAEQKSFFLTLLMGRGRNVAYIPGIAQRMDPASVKNRLAAAEDEIHGTFDVTVLKTLPHPDPPAEPIVQEPFVPADEIRGQGTDEEGILGGAEAAGAHEKLRATH